MTTDITVIQNAVGNGFRPMVRGPVTLIVGLIYALMLSRPLATVFAIILPVLAIVLGVITYRVSPLYRQLQTSMDHLNGVVQEDLTAVRVVKAYVRAEHECDKFDTVNTELAHTATKTFGNAVLNLPVFQLSMYVAAISILWIGGRMIIAGELGVGSLTGFMSYVLLIMNSLMMISNVFLLLTRALASVERISRVIDEQSLIQAPAADVAMHEVADGSVEFRDVSFKYRADAAEDVLEHIDLRIEPAPRWACSAARARARARSCSSSRACTTRPRAPCSWAARCARLRPGRPARCRGHCAAKERAVYGHRAREPAVGAPDATDEELLSACRAACVDEFLDRIGGLDGELGQGGAGVSGGQKQRLCIARTLLKQPRVLILTTRPARSIWRPMPGFASISRRFPIRP